MKLLIVDDSALMRRQLTQLFTSVGGFEIQQARNGEEAIELNLSFQPDVVTLDINMPAMDGLTALSRMMTERPVPVVMLSSLTEQGTLATLEALNLGAVDYIAKPGGTISLTLDKIKDDLVQRVTSAARARLRVARQSRASAQPLASSHRSAGQHHHHAQHSLGNTGKSATTPTQRSGLVVIGVSTGGPRTLEEILPALPAHFPLPVLVAQHMPAAFTRSFAERLDKICALRVMEVSSPTPITPGTIYIGRGGADMVVSSRPSGLIALPKPESSQYLWHPSVELLARSVQEHCSPKQVIAVMLTGMGNDGATQFTELKRRGARTIAESEETAVVFGMPAELIAQGGATVTLPCDQIAVQLKAWAGA